MKFVQILLASWIFIAVSTGDAWGDSPLLEDERNTIEVFKRVSPAVAYITTLEVRRDFFSRNITKIPRGTGSGFVWDKSGHVVTNAHVIQGGGSISVTLADGTSHEAKLVGADPPNDLAVLKIKVPKGELSPVVLGARSELQVGQKVLAIGNPFGLDQTLTTGIISALGREMQSRAKTTIQDVIQTDASINPGNSGGPLLDSRGRLIGVNTAIYSPSGASAGIGFAVPVGTVKRVVPQLIRFGKVRRAGLGVSIIPDDLAKRWRVKGVIVKDVMPNSTAARAGLRPSLIDRRGRVTLGDVIVGFGDDRIRSYDDLFTALEKHRPGDVVVVHFQREGRGMSVKVKLQEVGR